jgi:hypothetical protein
MQANFWLEAGEFFRADNRVHHSYQVVDFEFARPLMIAFTKVIVIKRVLRLCVCWRHEANQVHVHEAVAPPAQKKSARALADAPPLAAPAARGAGMADAVRLAHALLARLFSAAPATAARRAAGIPVGPLRH